MSTKVECKHCRWRLENDSDYNWDEYPCPRCKNTRLVPNPREMLCNLCGNCICPLGTMNEQYPHGLYNAEVIGGYNSNHLLDMNRYTFNFCEKCLRELFIKCKIKPEIHEMGFDGDIRKKYTWEEDQEAYEYNAWRDDGGHHQAFLNKKCNRAKNCPNRAVYTQLYNGEDFSEETICEEHKNEMKYINDKLVPFISNVLKTFL